MKNSGINEKMMTRKEFGNFMHNKQAYFRCCRWLQKCAGVKGLEEFSRILILEKKYKLEVQDRESGRFCRGRMIEKKDGKPFVQKYWRVPNWIAREDCGKVRITCNIGHTSNFARLW